MASPQPSVSEIMRRLSVTTGIPVPPAPVAPPVRWVRLDLGTRLISLLSCLSAAVTTVALIWWAMHLQETFVVIRTVAAERSHPPSLPALSVEQLVDRRAYAGLERIYPAHRNELTRRRVMALVQAEAWGEAQAGFAVLERELPEPWPAELAFRRVQLLRHLGQTEAASTKLRAIRRDQLPTELRPAVQRLMISLERRP